MAVKAAVRRIARKASKPRAPKRATRRVVRKKKFVSKKSLTGTVRMVWNGTKTYTPSGLTKKDLVKTKNGKVMSKAMLAATKKRAGRIKAWTRATKQARKQLGITGFVR